MITYHQAQKLFEITTNDSSYLFFINEHHHIEHIYYGPKVDGLNVLKDHVMRYQFELGSTVSYKEDAKGYQLNHLLLEAPTFGKGDYRIPSLHMVLPDGTRTLDLLYVSHEIIHNYHIDGYPQTTKNKTLKITLKDQKEAVYLHLFYTAFEAENIIVRHQEIENKTGGVITIEKALSMNLDMPYDYQLLSKLDGAWIREKQIDTHSLTKGIFQIDSKKGVSSADHNPAFLIHDEKATFDSGLVYGFALVYSGNFEANFEVSTHDLLRINLGINGFDFRYSLKQKEVFITPEVMMSITTKGFNQISEQFREGVLNHLVSKQHLKERPVLINNWEATYFDFNQKKLLAIAKKAKKLGIELLCLDDGWFGRRNDDTSSLGDWHVNQKKIPSGITKLAKKINDIGLSFGLWFEPEMISKDSDLYIAHPDWAIQVPGRDPALGRNQLVLDLTNKAVRDYIKDSIKNILNSANISYVKWDMNRNLTDIYSNHLSVHDNHAFHHLYVMGLYDILEDITSAFPNVLFESCASGGNRHDLGMLYYMPQTWTSDNTDALERIVIQEGAYLFYPLSSISNHVNSNVSHQVLRFNPLETRFNVAAFGTLGYELDVTELTPFDKKIIAAQIEFYKTYRELFQYGVFKRIYHPRKTVWMVHTKDKKTAIMLVVQHRAKANPGFERIKIPYLLDGTYRVTTRTQYTNIRQFGSLVNEALPIKLKVNHFLHNTIANRYLFKLDTFNKEITGKQLKHMGLLMHHEFTGTGYNDDVMLMPDGGSRMFIFNYKEEEKKDGNNED